MENPMFYFVDRFPDGISWMSSSSSAAEKSMFLSALLDEASVHGAEIRIEFTKYSGIKAHCFLGDIGLRAIYGLKQPNFIRNDKWYQQMSAILISNVSSIDCVHFVFEKESEASEYKSLLLYLEMKRSEG